MVNGVSARVRKSVNPAFRVCVAVIGIALAGCQHDVERLRLELTARQASWDRQLGTIKAEHASLKERFGREIGNTGVAATNPAALRARATIDGLRQSIADVEIQARQVGPRLEEATTHGSDAAEKLLEQESARMNGTFQALVADLAATTQQVNDFGNQRNTGNANE
jgi:hypothetical protein